MCPFWFYATTFWTFKYHLSLFETHLLNVFFGCIASSSRTLYLERNVENIEWIELREKQFSQSNFHRFLQDEQDNPCPLLNLRDLYIPDH